jgi:hypothetical protein
MSDVRDPAALVRHAAEVGDWRLVELLAHVLGGGSDRPLLGARRAYCKLVLLLGLSEPGGYDRR